MSPQIKERFEITGVSIIIGLLSLCVYFLVKIDNKVDYSYEANVEQKEINKTVKNKMEELETASIINDTRMDKMSERFYSLEAIIKYTHNTPN